MAIPQAVSGQVLDIRRQLAFRDDVEVITLVLYDGKGDELARLDHFWHVLPPRVQFGQSSETIQFLVVEDETALDSIMAIVRSVKYIVTTLETDPQVSTFSPPHRCQDIPVPPLGRNRKWDIKTTTTTKVSEFFRPPGQ